MKQFFLRDIVQRCKPSGRVGHADLMEQQEDLLKNLTSIFRVVATCTKLKTTHLTFHITMQLSFVLEALNKRACNLVKVEAREGDWQPMSTPRSITVPTLTRGYFRQSLHKLMR